MKKRILTVTLAAILVVAIMVVTTGCGNTSGTKRYEYNGVSINSQITSSYATFDEMIAFVYEDTFLKINDDGTWVIDVPLFLFFNSNIDEGTYTVEDGVYTFEGFEYGMQAYGVETSDGFEIYFMIPNGIGYSKAMSIYYR